MVPIFSSFLAQSSRRGCHVFVTGEGRSYDSPSYQEGVGGRFMRPTRNATIQGHIKAIPARNSIPLLFKLLSFDFFRTAPGRHEALKEYEAGPEVLAIHGHCHAPPLFAHFKQHE